MGKGFRTKTLFLQIVARPVIEELYEDSDIKKEVELLADLHLDEEASAYTIAIMLEKSVDKKQVSIAAMLHETADICRPRGASSLRRCLLTRVHVSRLFSRRRR